MTLVQIEINSVKKAVSTFFQVYPNVIHLKFLQFTIYAPFWLFIVSSEFFYNHSSHHCDVSINSMTTEFVSAEDPKIA